jgi:predicted ATPase
VLLALRLEELPARTPLASWLADLEREQEVTHLALAPLTAEDTTRLVASLASAAVSGGAVAEPAVARLSAQLFARTGGHPFFLLETLKVVLERQARPADDDRPMRDGAAAPDDAQTLQTILPPSVQARIGALLAPLSPAARALLLATAVLGPRSTFEPQCAVADLAEEEALAALDEVLARSLLRESGGTAPTYTFSYDPIREAVYAQAGPARRRLFQRRALALLERAGTPTADLVHQALGPGLRADGLLYNRAIGDDATRRSAVRDALAHAQSA